MSPTTVSTYDQATALPAGTYRLDPLRSTVTFTTRHLFGLRRVEGTFALRGGEVRVGDPLEDSAVSAVIAADSFTSGNPRRDADVRSAKLLGAAAHPDIAFTSDRLERTAEGWVVHGTLRALATSRPIALRIDRVHASTAEVALRAQARIDRYAFGVTGAKGFAARHLDLQLAIVARRVDREEVR